MKTLFEYIEKANIKNQDKIYLKGSIPLPKAQNAISEYCSNSIKYDDIICLIDDTVFGNCKAGLVITNDNIFCKAAFESANSFDINSINTVTATSGFLNTAILINGNKFAELTQPNGKALKNLFDEINNYLNDKSSGNILSVNLPPTTENNIVNNALQQFKNADLDSDALQDIRDLILNMDKQSRVVFDNIEKEILKQQDKIKILENEIKKLTLNKSNPTVEKSPINDSSLHSSSISTNNAVSKQKAIIESDEDSDGYEIFDIINSDNLFKLMKEMKFANSTIGFIGDFLGDPSPDEKVRRLLSSCIAYTVITLREQHIEKNYIKGLMNDAATFELTLFAVGLLKIRLKDRGISENSINKILESGITELMGGTSSKSNQISMKLTNLLPLSEIGMLNSYRDFEKTLRIRLLVSNKLRKSVRTEEISQIAEMENFRKAFGEEMYSEMTLNSESETEFMKNALLIVNFLAQSVLDDLFSDERVYNKLQYTMDELSRIFNQYK
jgi:hypothetical protein